MAREIELRAGLRYFWERFGERGRLVRRARLSTLNFSRCALTADGDVRAPSKMMSDPISEAYSDDYRQKRERNHSEKHSLSLT